MSDTDKAWKRIDSGQTDIECPRCSDYVPAADIIDGRCSECRIHEDEADWMDEDEDEGGSPWGR